MVLNLLGIVTMLTPSLGYKQCAEIAREGYETGKSHHDIVVKERKLLTQEKWPFSESTALPERRPPGTQLRCRADRSRVRPPSSPRAAKS